MPPGFQPAHLDGTICKNPKVAVGHGNPGIHPGWQEGNPAVHPLQPNGKPGAGTDFFHQWLQIAGRRTIRALNPDPIHIHVQDDEACILGCLLGKQQAFPAPGSHLLVGFNPPKAGILVTQISKTGHQQPLVRRHPGLEQFTAQVAGR